MKKQIYFIRKRAKFVKSDENEKEAENEKIFSKNQNIKKQGKTGKITCFCAAEKTAD